MKDNIIEFLYPKKTKPILENTFPIKAVQNIPDWFKKLKHDHKRRTIKGCIPVLDSLSAGYILKMPQDLYVHHNFTHGDKKDSAFKFSYGDQQQFIDNLKLNLNKNILNTHDIEQLGGKKGGCPFIEKNSNLNFYKIANPFRIKTPSGYSCLFIPPLNNRDDRFEIISGIVDTDTFPNYINFPIVLNGDKYPVLETIIEQGTPYVQIIPFKRQGWKMQIKEDTQEKEVSELSVLGKLIYTYKNFFWDKKSWK
jgi:hypothetical protein